MDVLEKFKLHEAVGNKTVGLPPDCLPRMLTHDAALKLLLYVDPLIGDDKRAIEVLKQAILAGLPLALIETGPGDADFVQFGSALSNAVREPDERIHNYAAWNFSNLSPNNPAVNVRVWIGHVTIPNMGDDCRYDCFCPSLAHALELVAGVLFVKNGGSFEDTQAWKAFEIRTLGGQRSDSNATGGADLNARKRRRVE